MQMEITDEVEIGHQKYCGGSTKITVNLVCANDNSIEKQCLYQVLDCIDTLDHSMIIETEEAKEFYQRYYIIEKDLRFSFHNIVASILYYRLPDIIKEYLISISVEWNKTKNTYQIDELGNWIVEMFDANGDV